jgi:hypothetical protein
VTVAVIFDELGLMTVTVTVSAAGLATFPYAQSPPEMAPLWIFCLSAVPTLRSAV